MQPELISIMMPAYNAERYIGQAIKSLLSQSCPQWELIIVNDGSTDGTTDVVAQFSDPRIKLLHQINAGEAAARNAALNRMQGEFVAFLDADDFYLPHHLELAVTYLKEHPSYDGVYSDGHYCDEAGAPIRTLSSRRIGPFEGRVFDEVVRTSSVFGPPVCVFLRRNVIARHNLSFDTNIVIGPDWDFFIQYADVGHFGHIDQSTCLYRVHESSITTQIGLQKRALDLAKIRMKAVKMESFRGCSAHTRFAVFYDLLVNLLRGLPEQQTSITHWSGFSSLPLEDQARLLRLMASKGITYGLDRCYIDEWLRRSRQLNPLDRKGALLSAIYSLSPLICKLLLSTKTLRQTDQQDIAPFADLYNV